MYKQCINKGQMNRTKPVCEWITKGKGQDLMCFRGEG